jgi:putative ABC transport system permease protein
MAASGLVQPGSLFSSAYRLRLPPGADVPALSKALSGRFKDAGYLVQDRSNGAPGTRRFIERLGQFLTLVGLAALIVAGIGVGNGVSSYLDGKRGTIATLKLLGATSRTIFLSYLLQIGLVAAGAIVAGLLVGALVPWIVTLIAGSALPVPPRLALYPLPLLFSAAYGLLIALAFAILPLARARTVPAASLFRGTLEPLRRPPLVPLAAALIAASSIAALAILTAREPAFAAGFIGMALALVLLLTFSGSAHPLDRLEAAAPAQPDLPAGADESPSPRRPDRSAGGGARPRAHLVHHARRNRDQPVGPDPHHHSRQGAELLHARHPCRGRAAVQGAGQAAPHLRASW